jgi:glycosyl transferase family 87
VAGLWTGVLLLGFNVYAAVTVYAPQYRFRNDFRLLYGVAHLVGSVGYGRLYDLTNQSQVVTDEGHFWQPFINPPPLVWLGTPFSLAPFLPAIWLWTAFLLAAAVVAWRLAAPGDRLGRAAHLALLAGLFPAAFSVMVGQVVVVVAAAVALAWWLGEQRRDVLAGVALSAMVLKPQLALLVPLCLLVAGRWRIFAGWFAAAGLLALLSAVLLGADGIQRYRDVLSLASHWALTRRFTFADLVGTGAALTALQVVVLVLGLAAAYRLRGRDLGLTIAAGIVASLLFTPYVGLQDLTMLVVAGWLIIRAGVPFWLGALLAAGYAILELAQVVLTWPVVTVEAALLVSLLAFSPDRRLGGDLRQPLAAARQEAGSL